MTKIKKYMYMLLQIFVTHSLGINTSNCVKTNLEGKITQQRKLPRQPQHSPAGAAPPVSRESRSRLPSVSRENQELHVPVRRDRGRVSRATAMAAPVSERLFSLELLVAWVRLAAGPLPPAVGAEEELEQEEGASPPPPPRSLCPAVAFRLLDFPTLLVYPRGGPAAPAPEPRPGLLRFGRGKSCLFRLPPATLRRQLLETPLYSLLLQLPPGRPTPAPQLLGTCIISLAAAAREVLGPVASSCSHGHRGNFPLHNHVGERIGDISLAYRLTDLGDSLLGHLRRPITSTEGGEEGAEVWEAAAVRSQAQQEKQPQRLDSDPSPRETDRTLQSLKHPKAQKDLKETVFHSQANSDNMGPAEHGKTSSVQTGVVWGGSAPQTRKSCTWRPTPFALPLCITLT